MLIVPFRLVMKKDTEGINQQERLGDSKIRRVERREQERGRQHRHNNQDKDAGKGRDRNVHRSSRDDRLGEPDEKQSNKTKGRLDRVLSGL